MLLSFFERMIVAGQQHIMLKMQHRCAGNIPGWVSKQFYHNQVERAPLPPAKETILNIIRSFVHEQLGVPRRTNRHAVDLTDAPGKFPSDSVIGAHAWLQNLANRDFTQWRNTAGSAARDWQELEEHITAVTGIPPARLVRIVKDACEDTLEKNAEQLRKQVTTRSQKENGGSKYQEQLAS
jgi:hypothetical protein